MGMPSRLWPYDVLKEQDETLNWQLKQSENKGCHNRHNSNSTVA